MLFADGAIYNTLVKAASPRRGVSYLVGDRTVIRGGVGLFSYPLLLRRRQPVRLLPAHRRRHHQNNGTTFLTDLTNPLPGGSLIQPAGSSLGLATGLGLPLGTVVPSERKSPYYVRWQAGSSATSAGAGWWS